MSHSLCYFTLCHVNGCVECEVCWTVMSVCHVSGCVECNDIWLHWVDANVMWCCQTHSGNASDRTWVCGTVTWTEPQDQLCQGTVVQGRTFMSWRQGDAGQTQDQSNVTRHTCYLLIYMTLHKRHSSYVLLTHLRDASQTSLVIRVTYSSTWRFTNVTRHTCYLLIYMTLHKRHSSYVLLTHLRDASQTLLSWTLRVSMKFSKIFLDNLAAISWSACWHWHLAAADMVTVSPLLTYVHMVCVDVDRRWRRYESSCCKRRTSFVNRWPTTKCHRTRCSSSGLMDARAHGGISQC